jgi:hypothetical protein
VSIHEASSFPNEAVPCLHVDAGTAGQEARDTLLTHLSKLLYVRMRLQSYAELQWCCLSMNMHSALQCKLVVHFP